MRWNHQHNIHISTLPCHANTKQTSAREDVVATIASNDPDIKEEETPRLHPCPYEDASPTAPDEDASLPAIPATCYR